MQLWNPEANFDSSQGCRKESLLLRGKNICCSVGEIKFGFIFEIWKFIFFSGENCVGIVAFKNFKIGVILGLKKIGVICR